MKQKTSQIWKYFIEADGDHVMCKVCVKLYSRKGRGTTALKNHLRSHSVQYAEFIKNEEEKKHEKVEAEVNLRQPVVRTGTTRFTTTKSCQTPSIQELSWTATSTTPLQQVTLQESILEKSSWDTSHPKSMEYDKLICEMIALQNLPFNFVEGIGFRRLVHAMEPRYNLQSPHFFTTNMTDEIYPKVVSKVKDLLKSIQYLSFTADIWSEHSAGVSLFGLTCHGITKDFQRISLMLSYETLGFRHTGDITEKIDSVLKYWEIPPEKVHCIVRDGGANMKRAMRASNYNDIDCAIHELQLCIRTALESQVYVTQLLGKCKQIEEHFKHSVIAQDQLNKVQKDILNQAPLALVQDCPTRLNSSVIMMEWLLQIKDALSVYSNKNTHVQQLTPQEWLDIEECVQILKPFEEVTKTVSNSQTTIASVIPLTHVLKTFLHEEEMRTTNPILTEVVKTLTSEINARFGDLFNDNMFVLATYLDPRFKLKFFNDILKDKVQKETLSLLKIIQQVNSTDESPQNKRARLNDAALIGHYKVPTITNLLADALHSSDEDSVPDSIELMDKFAVYKSILIEYNKSKKMKIDEDPLQWWRNNTKFEILHNIVRKYLSPPPSSVPSQQLFSGAGFIYEELKSRLEAEKAFKLLFLKYNLPLLNFTY